VKKRNPRIVLAASPLRPVWPLRRAGVDRSDRRRACQRDHVVTEFPAMGPLRVGVAVTTSWRARSSPGHPDRAARREVSGKAAGSDLADRGGLTCSTSRPPAGSMDKKVPPRKQLPSHQHRDGLYPPPTAFSISPPPATRIFRICQLIDREKWRPIRALPRPRCGEETGGVERVDRRSAARRSTANGSELLWKPAFPAGRSTTSGMPSPIPQVQQLRIKRSVAHHARRNDLWRSPADPF